MPGADFFTYAGSKSNNFGDTWVGGGFDGIPIINIGTIDVTNFYKYYAMTSQQACEVYWNLAGISNTVKAKSPAFSVSNPNPPPSSFSNASDLELTVSGEHLMTNNSSGYGFQPGERMLAYPLGNSEDEYTNNFNATDAHFPVYLNVERFINSVSSIKAMYAGGSFVGYGFGNLAYTFAEANAGTGSSPNTQLKRKRYKISSWFEDELEGDVPDGATGDYDINYSQVNFGGGIFWEQEEDIDYLFDSTEEAPTYDHGFELTISSPTAVTFSYS